MFELERISDYLIEKRGITNLKNINVYDLRSYFRMKQDMGNKATTIIAMWKVVHAFFSWCIEEKYLRENPMDAVECPKPPKKVIQAFTNQDVKKMIQVFSEKNYIEMRNKTIIATLADCGLRSIEIRRLKPESFS